jgi:hypothetical protein
MYALEFAHCPLPAGVDYADLSWSPVRGVVFTSDVEAQGYADEATAESDGALVFRVVESNNVESDGELARESERPGLAKTIAPAAREKGAA